MQYAHEDVYLKTKLGEENFSLFTQYIETCINLGIGSQLPPPDYRDFYMFTYTKQLADHFLKKDEKLIIHAHSAHLSNLERFDSFPYKEIPAGNRLKKYYGDKYYSIGFQVGKGARRTAEQIRHQGRFPRPHVDLHGLPLHLQLQAPHHQNGRHKRPEVPRAPERRADRRL